MKQETAECCEILASSGVIGNNGIGYGGIDNNGDMDPSAKESNWSIWADE